MEESSNVSQSDMVLETLNRRGWVLGDLEQVKAIIIIRSALADDSSKVVNSVESELLNSDLRSIGGKSLPDPSSLLRKSTYLQGPKVLQISSVRDISKSSVDDVSRNSGGRRLLRLCLTDGHSEITAIEYSHVPSIPDNVVPGTKICLENKVAIHWGIVCLNPKVVTVLGGVVQSLYEEWQMNQKYSGFSRSHLRRLEESDTGGPPPFEKLQVGSSLGYAKSNPRSSKPATGVGNTEMRSAGNQRTPDWKARPDKNEEKPSSSGTRLKEVVESVPVANQPAAQKLLQKLSHPNQDDRHPRGRKNRWREREKREDPEVFTLEEYENRKAQAKPPVNVEVPDVSHDENLAWELQNQFNLEDSPVQGGSNEAEDIKMSMFNYERDQGISHQTGHGGRGRGWGKGRGRGRGRGGARGRHG
ncbi:hypothetical protein L6164_011338 [Bauhinia variegata]|uniref:Uncharacterized protein n=1 Tax=Bauhinia variegata TaxID=167791 RepID=A0ACB9P864_BAUVA|nr:hypothetical protein L6164_011338 [Bauhinia variegata]